MMDNSRTTRNLTAIIFFLILQLTIILAQKPGEITVRLTDVQKGTEVIDKSEWEKISLVKGETLYLGFTASQSSFYRIFLDGVMIEPKHIESYYTLRNLDPGTHILKIIAYTENLVESAPLLLTFSVTEQSAESNSEKPIQVSRFTDPLFIYGLAGLCVVLFVVVLVLLVKRSPHDKNSKRLVEELSAMAIHDIKNPASAIRGYIELLNSYELNANEHQEIMASLVASSEDIVKLSQDMCTIIAKALPEPKLKLDKCSLKNLVDDVFNQNASYAKAKKVKFYNKNAIELPEVKMDPEKIEEALDNLVNNAIKYAPPETIVEVRTYVKDLNKKTIVVEVKDNGVGLSEDDLKRSFQKGSVLSAKPTGLEQSSGLGLWIVKKIIEEHGGKVWVESKQGVGSTFAFELPY